MNILQFISNNLGSPIVTQRNKALTCLIKEITENLDGIKQLKVNLKSDNLDIVWFSLKAILAISFRDTTKLKTLRNIILNLAKKSSHFGIVNLCKLILNKLDNQSYSSNIIFKRLQPTVVDSTGMRMFHDNCVHSLKFALGNEHYSYVLSHICRAFRYDCKKAESRLYSYMKGLGYIKNKKYWKDMPEGWRRHYLGDSFETRLAYFARHGLQMLLMWCSQNLTAYSEDWEELLVYERDFDPAVPDQLLEEKPDFVQFEEHNIDSDVWLKKKVTIEEAYNFLNPNAEWIPLYEHTKFKSDTKSYDRYVTTCFSTKPTPKLPKKRELATVNYECRRCFINDVPIEAYKNKWLYVRNDNHRNKFDHNLIPAYGIISEDFDEYTKLFPAPEIVEYFNLKQKPNTLEFYKGKELVVRNIDWRSGFHRNIGTGRDDRFELANYGHLLMIKSKYLKRYLKGNNLNLIAVGNVWKWKLENSTRDYSLKDKNSKYEWFPSKIVKI